MSTEEFTVASDLSTTRGPKPGQCTHSRRRSSLQLAQPRTIRAQLPQYCLCSPQNGYPTEHLILPTGGCGMVGHKKQQGHCFQETNTERKTTQRRRSISTTKEQDKTRVKERNETEITDVPGPIQSNGQWSSRCSQDWRKGWEIPVTTSARRRKCKEEPVRDEEFNKCN